MTNENERPYPAGYYFDDKKDEVSVEAVTEAPTEVKAETIETPEVSPSEVAKQRRESIVNFFKNSKTNFKNTMQNIGGGISRFFGKAKSLGNETLDVIVAPDAYIKKGAENLLEWARNKKEIVSNFAKSKGELLQAIARLAESKITENITEVKTKIDERYEGLKQYGHDAMESAAVSIRDIKEGLRNKKNNLIIAFLKSVEESHRAKADRVASTIQLLQGLKSN